VLVFDNKRELRLVAGGTVGFDVLESWCPRLPKPFRIKDNVHRDKPRSVSGRWMAAVINVENERMNVILGDKDDHSVDQRQQGNEG